MALTNKVELLVPNYPPHYISQERISLHDVNSGQHLSLDRFLVFADEAYYRYLYSLSFDLKGFFGLASLVASVQVQFISQGFYGENISINLWITEHSKSGYRIFFQFTKEDQEVGRVQMDRIFFDYNEQKVKPCPEAFIEFYKKLPR
jgi:acyl-CoA thioesterase FadM